jgi:hypothetical protein
VFTETVILAAFAVTLDATIEPTLFTEPTAGVRAVHAVADVAVGTR